MLYLRFFRGLTQSEIAEEIGVSQMHVSRILVPDARVPAPRGGSKKEIRSARPSLAERIWTEPRRDAQRVT